MEALISSMAAAAASGAAAPIGATVAAATPSFTGLAYGAQALGGLASGLSAYSSGKAAEEQAKINSFIGRTRAMQTDVAAREGLESELGTLRATLAANGQRANVGTMEILSELRRVRSRDRRIEFNNRMQEASAYRMAAKNAGSEARMGLWGGMLKAAPSVFDIYDLKQKQQTRG